MAGAPLVRRTITRAEDADVSTSPPPGLWHQATSSRGGRWATGVAIGAVALLLLVAAIALAHVARADRGQDERHGPSKAQPQGPQAKPGAGDNGQGKAQDKGQSRGAPAAGDENGIPGQLGKGVLHGEVTRAAATGVPEVILVQLGAVTAATDTSVAVRSDDGYVDSYVVSTTTTLRGPARAAGLAVGTRVTVVAQKEGKAALLVATTGRSS